MGLTLFTCVEIKLCINSLRSTSDPCCYWRRWSNDRENLVDWKFGNQLELSQWHSSTEECIFKAEVLYTMLLQLCHVRVPDQNAGSSLVGKKHPDIWRTWNKGRSGAKVWSLLRKKDNLSAQVWFTAPREQKNGNKSSIQRIVESKFQNTFKSMPEQTSSKSSSEDNSLACSCIFFHCKRWSSSLLSYHAHQSSCSWSSEGTTTTLCLGEHTKVKAAKISPRQLKTGTVVGPYWELRTSHPPCKQDSNHRYISWPFFSHYTNLGYTNCAGGQVSSPELSTLVLPWQSPRCSCSHACSMQAIKWQHSEAPLKRARVMENDSAELTTRQSLVCTTYLLVVMQGEQGHEKNRKKRKKQRHIQNKASKKLKSFWPLCQGIPVVNSMLFQRGKQDTYGQARIQALLGQEAEPSRNGLNSHQARADQGL